MRIAPIPQSKGRCNAPSPDGLAGCEKLTPHDGAHTNTHGEAWAQRRALYDWDAPYRSSLRVRWTIFCRHRRFTWRDWREDLRYLFRG